MNIQDFEDTYQLLIKVLESTNELFFKLSAYEDQELDKWMVTSKINAGGNGYTIKEYRDRFYNNYMFLTYYNSFDLNSTAYANAKKVTSEKIFMHNEGLTLNGILYPKMSTFDKNDIFSLSTLHSFDMIEQLYISHRIDSEKYPALYYRNSPNKKEKYIKVLEELDEYRRTRK